ncbi:hypothetical protein PINS_up003493 [Pythium insidiosum]|nr:hypothetical protein PINS_up003493 [Pythium insidiosum]
MARSKQSARRPKAKRQDLDASADRASKKQKQQPSDEAVAKGSCQSENVLSRLLGGMPMSEFMAEYFEKKPLLVRRKANDDLFPKGLFSRETLLDVVGTHELEIGKDMTICKYANGERDNYVPEDGNPRAKKKNVSSLLNNRYSCQFYQPQRYVDGLYHLNAAFEEYFGCLAGASAYLTPPGAQALAPHHDDVEVFILQTEGRKKWKLYHPMVELPGEHSSDLSEESIGNVWMELTLEEGDVLYFPRGVIHQAATDDVQFSTHVTISVYQHQSWANFLEVVLPRIVRRAFDSDVTFRKGLPVNYLSFMGTQFPGSSSGAVSFVEQCKSLVTKLGTWVDVADVQQACDEAALDFFANRLPPDHGPAVDTADFLLSPKAKIRFRSRNSIRLMIGEDDSKETIVSVLHSVRNCRIHHMGMCSCVEDDEDEGEDDDGGVASDASDGGSDEEDDESDDGDATMGMPPQPRTLVFPGSLLQPLMQLYTAFPKDIAVADIVKGSSDETEARGMLLRLWSEGLLTASA